MIENKVKGINKEMDDETYKQKAQEWLDNNPPPPPDSMSDNDHVMGPQSSYANSLHSQYSQFYNEGASTQPEQKKTALGNRIESIIKSAPKDNDSPSASLKKETVKKETIVDNISKDSKAEVIKDLRRIELLVSRIRKNLGLDNE